MECKVVFVNQVPHQNKRLLTYDLMSIRFDNFKWSLLLNKIITEKKVYQHVLQNWINFLSFIHNLKTMIKKSLHILSPTEPNKIHQGEWRFCHSTSLI